MLLILNHVEVIEINAWPSDVGLLAAYPSLLFLALHIRVSYVSQCTFLTCLASFMLDMLVLCHLAWLSLFVCIFCILVICSCMCLCVLVYVIKLSSYLQSHVGSHPSLYMRSWVPFGNFSWWHVSSVLQYNRTTNTKSKPTFFLLRHPFFVFLFDNMFVAPLCASFVSLLSLLLVYWLCVFFVVACTCLERWCNF